MSAYAIHEKITGEMNGKIDVVSVYRILVTLQEVGVVVHIGIVDGYVPKHETDIINDAPATVAFTGTGPDGRSVDFFDEGDAEFNDDLCKFMEAVQGRAERLGLLLAYKPTKIEIRITNKP